MENTRADLAEKMEIIGQIFEIDGMSELLKKFEPEVDEEGKKKPTNIVKFNAVVIQVSALLLKNNKPVADKIICMNLDETEKTIQEMDDGTYAKALRNALTTDVLGFFASSQPSDGGK